MRRGSRTLCVPWLVITALLFWAVTSDAADPTRGRLLFEQGDPAIGVRLAGSARLVPWTQFACAGCHGSDGRGGREGGLAVPAIHWRELATATRTRPGYDAAAFARVLREGVDPAGRELHPVMPRFSLADADVAALLAWLRVLDRPRVPGVDDDRLALGLLLPDAGANPAAAGVRRLAEAVIANWNSAGGFWGRRLVLVDLRSPTSPPDVFAIILRMTDLPEGLKDVPDLLPLRPVPGASALGLLPGEAEIDRLLQERASRIEQAGLGPVVVVRTPEELRRALVASPVPRLIGSLDRLAEALADLPHDRSFTLELLDVHPFVDPTAEEARKFSALASRLGLHPRRAGLARLAYASLHFVELALSAAGRHLDRQRFLAILRSLPPQATGLLPAMRPGEPLPLDRLMLWRLDSPQGRISRQPAAELTSTASSTSR